MMALRWRETVVRVRVCVTSQNRWTKLVVTECELVSQRPTVRVSVVPSIDRFEFLHIFGFGLSYNTIEIETMTTEWFSHLFSFILFSRRHHTIRNVNCHLILFLAIKKIAQTRERKLLIIIEHNFCATIFGRQRKCAFGRENRLDEFLFLFVDRRAKPSKRTVNENFLFVTHIVVSRI